IGFTPNLVITAPQATPDENGIPTFTFTAMQGSPTANPASLSFTITNNGQVFSAPTLTVATTVETPQVSWLEVKPNQLSLATGQTSTLTVLVHPESLQPLFIQPTVTFSGTITITDTTNNTTKQLNVKLTVSEPNESGGTFSAQYSTLAFLNGPTGSETQISG